MKLYYIEFSDGYGFYMNELEYNDFARAMILLSVEYTAEEVTEPMYAIQWYDYIDEDWIVEWCTPEEIDDMIQKIKAAEVEYYIDYYE